jgi:ribonuclease P protein component
MVLPQAGLFYFCNMPGTFTLGKQERLKSRKLIGQLFSEGKKIAVSPYYIYYLANPVSEVSLHNIQFGVGVSGKNFKKAADRNRIKRLTREAYRLQKIPLQQKMKGIKKQLLLFFIYTGKELPEFNFVKEKVAVALKKLEKSVD